jgi:hypothetical protein
MDRHTALRDLYAAFNARDADALLAALAEDVRWPNGWEGGWLDGRAAVRDYWRRQWAEIEPAVEPTALVDRPDGTVAVHVHQTVHDHGGALLADTNVTHVYAFHGDLVASMSIEDGEATPALEPAEPAE